jgi:flagellar biosynthetic protein FliR
MTEAAFLNGVGLFLIALVRFSGFFLNTPVFSDNLAPTRVKAGLCALCSTLMLPHLIATTTLPNLSVTGYGIMVIKELTLGFMLGFIVMFLTSALRMGGNIIGMQIGFSYAQVADPGSNQSIGIISEILQLSGSLLFLFLGGHLIILRAFYQSFQMVPPAGLVLTNNVIEEILLYSRMIFICGLQIAMPIIAVILAGDVALGIIARTVPRMNIFQLGFAIKIIAGMIVIYFFINCLGDLIRDLLNLSLEEVMLVLKHLGGA